MGNVVEDVLHSHEVIVVSNRGPFGFVERNGTIERERGSGGLVTALSPIGRHGVPLWVAASRNEAELEMNRLNGALVEDGPMSYRMMFVPVDEEQYHGYYNVIANPLLWFIHHYMWNPSDGFDITSETWDAWNNGYLPVNRQFAEVVAEAVRSADQPPIILVQDYHLYLVPEFLRQQDVGCLIHFFLHIPFPSPGYFRVLPPAIRQTILSSLLACDIVGLQTPRFVRNCLRAIELFVPSATVDHAHSVVIHDGRTITFRAYPVSIDVEHVTRLAHSEEAERELRALTPRLAELNIMRVERIEPSKNIVRGFQAYRMLLANHPELHEHVKFIAFLVPPRKGVIEYTRYWEEILTLVGNINLEFGTSTWQPVETFIGHNYVRALAGMRLFDVLLVNPLVDGMNVVVKEGVVVNERDGVIILSEGAGTYEQFAPLPIGVNPIDVAETAEALYAALHMSRESRRAIVKRLKIQVQEHGAQRWMEDVFTDIGTFMTGRIKA